MTVCFKERQGTNSSRSVLARETKAAEDDGRNQIILIHFHR